MRKLLSIVVLLAFLALPAFAQLALFPTPAKVSGGKGSFTIGTAYQEHLPKARFGWYWMKN